MYYWFAARVVAAGWGLGEAMVWSVRIAALALICTWLVRALSKGARDVTN